MIYLSETIFVRQSGWLNPERLKETKVTIIGCGSLGSSVATALAKMGIGKFMLFDDDVVEAHNTPNQFFLKEEVGLKKVDALEKRIKQFSPHPDKELEIIKYPFKFIAAPEEPLGEFLVIAVANNESRQKILKIIEFEENPVYIIDTRSGGLFITVYALGNDEKRKERWKKELEGATPIEVDCTEQTIIFTVLYSAATVASIIFNVLRNRKDQISYSYEFDCEHKFCITGR